MPEPYFQEGLATSMSDEINFEGVRKAIVGKVGPVLKPLIAEEIAQLARAIGRANEKGHHIEAFIFFGDPRDPEVPSIHLKTPSR